MTVKEAKDQLPTVKVQFGKKTYWCLVRGRLNQFASVYVPEKQWLGAEFSWESIAWAATNNTTLKA